MRVIFLTHNYPRFAGDVAGGFLHPLARALRSAGCDLEVIAPSDRGAGSPADGPELLDGVPVRRVRYAAPGRERLGYEGRMVEYATSPVGLWTFLGLLRAFRKSARQAVRGDTVIHAHWWVPAGLAAPPELPLCVTLHGTDARLLTANPLTRVLGRSVLRRARAVTCVSHAVARTIGRITGQPVPGDRVIPMAVDTRGWTWSVGGGGIVVIARLTPQKRVHLAIEAAAVLRARGLDCPWTIVGDGPERPGLESRVRSLGLEGQVRFLGMLPPDEIPARLGTADLCVLPAREEGFGLSVVEAVMTGVPSVVCTDGGGVRDIVPSQGAGRTAAPTPDAIADAVQDLIADPEARPAAQRLGEEWRRRLSPETVAQRFLDLYAEVLHG